MAVYKALTKAIKLENLKAENIMKERIKVRKELLKQAITVQNTFIGVVIGVLFTVINIIL